MISGEFHGETGLVPALIFISALIIFHGSIYLLIALNLGWRFGYWVTGACLGTLWVFLSIFWILGPDLGPRDQEMLYLTGSIVWTAVHLWGLHRAEQRKTSPMVTTS